MIKLERAKKLFEEFESADTNQVKMLLWYLVAELEANEVRNDLYYYLKYILNNRLEKYGLVVKVFGKETIMLTRDDFERIIKICEESLQFAKQQDLDQTLFF